MKKQAGIATAGEELARVKGQVLTRADIKATADVLFHNGADARKEERSFLDKLFLQAGFAETSPNLSKEAMVKNTATYFEKRAYLTDAQRRYPELLKVAESDTKKVLPKKPAPTDPKAVPVQSSMSGGAA